jgi:uncharacterized protein YjdB
MIASIPGGSWSTSDATIATIDGAGTVSTVAAGSVTVSYSVTTTCGTAVATHALSVQTMPVVAGTVSGASIVCAGGTTALTSSITGGTWSSSDATIATVDTAGTVAGVAAGSATITYTMTNSCGSASDTRGMTVAPAPVVATISGPASLCAGATATYTDATAGGAWGSSDTTIATISATGVVNAMAAGTAILSYSISASCGVVSATTNITINSLPAVGGITGATAMCAGTTTTLTDATTGGAWSTSDTTVATVSATGVVTAHGAGVATIAYSVSNAAGCMMTVSLMDTVNAVPVVSAISGGGNVCLGSSILLTDATAGGTWSSSNASVASVSASGIVTGASLGSATITYSVGIAGCSAMVTTTATVDPVPSVSGISGTMTVCAGTVTSLTDTTLGGVWGNLDTAIGTLSSTGVLSTHAAGMDTILYTVTNSFGCGATAMAVVTVNAGPAVSAISGADTVCAGSTVALTETTPGGTWSSSTAAVATIDATGVLTAISGGTTTVAYTVSGAGGCSTTVSRTEHVEALPTVAAISGGGSMCMTGTTVLTDATAGGVWTSSNTAVATVSATGVVTPVGMGTATISYTVASVTGCATTVTMTETVDTGSVAGTLLGAGNHTLCHGNPVGMAVSGSVGGLTYQWYRDGILIAGATGSTYMATNTGSYTVVISNGMCSSTLGTVNVIAPPAPVVHAGTGSTIYTGSFASYQWLLNGSPIAGATSSVYSATAGGNYSVIVSDANGCSDTSAVFVISGGINDVNNVSAMDIRLYPNPATSVITIDAPAPVSVTIHTTDGRQIGRFGDAKTIDVGSLANGMYLIMVYGQDGTLLRTDKFIKE